jgi:hypothetical protein
LRTQSGHGAPGKSGESAISLSSQAIEPSLGIASSLQINKEEEPMPVYLVERSLPGIEMEQLAAAQKAAIETSRVFTAEGKEVRYIRTTFVPGEAHCLCLFEAASAELVQEVNEAAKIPFTRIVEALDLTPQ